VTVLCGLWPTILARAVGAAPIMCDCGEVQVEQGGVKCLVNQ